MGGTSKAENARMAASPVGVDRVAEPRCGGWGLGDDRPGFYLVKSQPAILAPSDHAPAVFEQSILGASQLAPAKLSHPLMLVERVFGRYGGQAR